MDAGKLNTPITIEQPIEDHSDGKLAITWQPLVRMPVWAEVRPLTSREYFAAQQQQAEITHRVTIRHRLDVTAKCRVKIGSRVLEIAGTPRNIDEANIALEFDCKETAP